MLESAKHLEKADKFLQKGKLSLALEELRQLLGPPPRAERSARSWARSRAGKLKRSRGPELGLVNRVGSSSDGMKR